MITALLPPDSFHARAAEGWLELGNSLEARHELEQIAPQMRTHPGVLHVQWEIDAAEKNWEPALGIATNLIELAPDDPLGWVHRSYALHELKRTQEARDNLLRVVDKFPSSATMRYNLACYECQLGNLPQAKVWLELTFRMGNRSQMKLAALQDPDLKPLWPEIRPG
jgi:predicted Zn-dependent protease